MGRPKSFEPDTALDAAVEVFWANGYEATSLDELSAALNITRPALYRHWGSKEGLYQAALERYREIGSGAFLRALEQRPHDAATIIRDRLLEIVDEAVNDDRRRGCMIVNATCERANADPNTATQVSAALTHLEQRITDALETAAGSGAISHPNPPALAKLLVVVIQGLRVVGKARPDNEAFAGVVDEAVHSMIGEWG